MKTREEACIVPIGDEKLEMGEWTKNGWQIIRTIIAQGHRLPILRGKECKWKTKERINSSQKDVTPYDDGSIKTVKASRWDSTENRKTHLKYIFNYILI